MTLNNNENTFRVRGYTDTQTSLHKFVNFKAKNQLLLTRASQGESDCCCLCLQKLTDITSKEA